MRNPDKIGPALIYGEQCLSGGKEVVALINCPDGIDFGEVPFSLVQVFIIRSFCRF
jgi:hypothetical protein